MYSIESVYVESFWGEHDLEFNFYEDVNFVIGINGSGKTTVIDIIVAALSADYVELQKHDFKKIIIRLKSKKSRKKPSITINKTTDKGDLFPSIEYEIKESASEKALALPKEDLEDIYFLDKYRSMYEGRAIRRKTKTVRNILSELVNLSWLSVHRASANGEQDTQGYTVDIKLRELTNRLVRYFSGLEKLGSDELENFQRTVFLSMLHRKTTRKALFPDAKNLNLEEEKQALEGIFRQFKFEPKDFKSRLDNHFDALTRATHRLQEDEQLTVPDISVLIGTERIDYIVDEWKKYLEKRQFIYESRDTFLKIINSMMQRKTFSINSQNELQVTTQSRKNLPLARLSSGEKQLLIVLGESLLQEKDTWVYIADEPELSLHVMWQESLVENLRAINPNSQIIFATHSPDVVSTFDKKVFDMEKILS